MIKYVYHFSKDVKIQEVIKTFEKKCVNRFLYNTHSHGNALEERRKSMGKGKL